MSSARRHERDDRVAGRHDAAEQGTVDLPLGDHAGASRVDQEDARLVDGGEERPGPRPRELPGAAAALPERDRADRRQALGVEEIDPSQISTADREELSVRRGHARQPVDPDGDRPRDRFQGEGMEPCKLDTAFPAGWEDESENGLASGARAAAVVARLEGSARRSPPHAAATARTAATSTTEETILTTRLQRIGRRSSTPRSGR
jgi:hypothetical protein